MNDPWNYEDEIMSQLDRVLCHSLFKGAKRSSSFLRYVSTQVLCRESYKIKEFSIAVDAFGLETTFDQQIDPRIRVEAKRLRDRLNQYYDGPGQNDPIIIDIPKGSYIPEFSFNTDSEKEDAGRVPDPADPLSILFDGKFNGELRFFFEGGLEVDGSLRTFQSHLVHQLFKLAGADTSSLSLGDMMSLQQNALPLVFEFHIIRDGGNIGLHNRIKLKSSGMLIQDSIEAIGESDLKRGDTSLLHAKLISKNILEFLRSLK